MDKKSKDEKLQYNINRERAEISALSSGKIDKYGNKNHTGEEIIPSVPSQIIHQAKFTYTTKTINDQGFKQIKTVEKQKRTQ